MKKLFQRYLGFIDKILGNDTTIEKKKYSDIIVINEEGKILLLLRSMSDDFHPGEWSLPGGSIEKDEHSAIAAVRELQEETGLVVDIEDIEFFKTIEKDDCIINYYIVSVNDIGDTDIVLDNYEHQGYEWVSSNEIVHKNLLLDLKQFLIESFDIQPEIWGFNSQDVQSFTDKLDDTFITLNKAFDDNLITEEVYFDKIKHLNIIKSEYDNSIVTINNEDCEVTYRKLNITNISKAEDNDELNLNDEYQKQYENYLDSGYLYNDRLYDATGIGIPIEPAKVAGFVQNSPNIYKVDCYKLDSFKSGSKIFEDTQRYKFDQVLPTIKKYDDYYNKYENELKNSFSSAQNDFKQRRSEIKKSLNSYFEDAVHDKDSIFDILNFIKSSLKEDIDPLLNIHFITGIDEEKKRQIFLSELEDYLNQNDTSFFLSNIEIVGLDGYNEGQFNIEYYDPNKIENITAIHEKAKSKVNGKANYEQNLYDQFEAGEIDEDEFLEQLFLQKAENSEEIKHTDEELIEHAKNTSLMDLERIIKESPDPKLREKAHEEIKRREEEEHIKDKEENKKKVKKAEDLDIQKAEEILKGCLMFYPKVNKDKWKQKIESIIPQEIVQEYEFDPHLTILYGFDDLQIDKNRLEQIVNEFIEKNPIEIKLLPVSLFRNSEFDVIKIGIQDINGNLTSLNQHVRNNFKYENNFPDYSPHMTLAYVNKGEGEQFNGMFIDLDDFGFLTLNNGDYIYSNSNKQKTVIRPYISDELAWNKGEDDDLEKGRKSVPIGTKSKDGKFVKQAHGWEYLKGVKSEKKESRLDDQNYPDIVKNGLSFMKNSLNLNNVNIKIINKKETMHDSGHISGGVIKEGGEYKVYLDFKNTEFGLIRKLAHELTHVKQMEDGRLEQLENGNISFEGQIYTPESYKELYHSDNGIPFENEAFNDERKLANSYWNSNE